MATSSYVGIDVSKDKLDVGVLGRKQTKQVSNTKDGIVQLVKEMVELQLELIVVEATGGYQRAVVDALFHARLSLAVVNPARVRHCRAAACPSQWSARQDGSIRCVCTGSVWENHAAQALCRQK